MPFSPTLQPIPDDFIDTRLLKWSRDSILSQSPRTAPRAMKMSPARVSTTYSQTSPIAASSTSSPPGASRRAATASVVQPEDVKSRMSLRRAEFINSQHRSSLLVPAIGALDCASGIRLSSGCEPAAAEALPSRARAFETARPSLQVLGEIRNPIIPRESDTWYDIAFQLLACKLRSVLTTLDLIVLLANN